DEFAPTDVGGYDAKVMSDARFMRLALRLARRGYGLTSPNPMVGAVLVKGGKIIGRGWHRRAGLPHAEIEALQDVQKRGCHPKGATLYVTLEPCTTHGRTPPCTDAIIAAGIKRVVVGTTDPNPNHSGRAFKILRLAGIEVTAISDAAGNKRRTSSRGLRPPSLPLPTEERGGAKGRLLANECVRLNETFNHWIVHRTPFVTVKAAMTLDGKIATASGESKWITGEIARAEGMKMRQGTEAILVGINTVLADDPSLTVRRARNIQHSTLNTEPARPRRIVLDSLARTPLKAKVVNDKFAALTTIVVGKRAPKNRVVALAKRVKVILAPTVGVGRASSRAGSSVASPHQRIDLPWLLKKLGAENITSLLVEGGGEVNASFLLSGLAQRVAFFYAPKVLGGRDAHKAVAGEGAESLAEALQLREVEWKRLGPDLLLTACIAPQRASR
ncbi:MAG TPA: bifunctional diaminohydroxyphosphoribosylaminopyrimidine deaminase/5-amino-6-(5-phosphoribosylamino)uracil reductase RibD, partial [Verrucomicrobiae bacterium]|nr:bifunctional diaminohydroxyphosphoribosylaminopyrimidine deaminase/5-amino-6-(5-phosphoribosylamino)uracil reductase RibD [Verrucomicrobiae bacterium]